MTQDFISQAAPDIRHKIRKLHMGPQTNQNQLIDTTSMVYNNRDLEEVEREYSKKKTAEIMATVIGDALNTQKASKGNPKGHKDNAGKSSGYKYKKSGH